MASSGAKVCEIIGKWRVLQRQPACFPVSEVQNSKNARISHSPYADGAEPQQNLPRIKRRQIWLFGLLFLGGLLAPDPAAPDAAIVATIFATCLGLAVRDES